MVFVLVTHNVTHSRFSISRQSRCCSLFFFGLQCAVQWPCIFSLDVFRRAFLECAWKKKTQGKRIVVPAFCVANPVAAHFSFMYVDGTDTFVSMTASAASYGVSAFFFDIFHIFSVHILGSLHRKSDRLHFQHGHSWKPDTAHLCSEWSIAPGHTWLDRIVHAHDFLKADSSVNSYAMRT